ncbi:hypothetical protein N9N49_04955 [Candidatus Pelagibacter bacterium]|nr:hypothetical protein [Candidatus Pelagibacter bacterium]MDA8829331.1 hypothetical protein [Candidatus Pelagibacter bacterium]
MKKISSIIFVLFYFLIMCPAYAEHDEDVSGDVSISVDNNHRQLFTLDGTSLTITNTATLTIDAQHGINIKLFDNKTVAVDPGSTVTATGDNAIQGKGQSGLTVTNSGTINTDGSKAINLKDAADSTITNNLGGIISGVGDSISGESATGVNIANNGTIYSDNGRALTFFSTSTSTATVTNNSSGHIYNSNTNEAIKLDGSSTLTNSGKIENKNSPDNNSIVLEGNDNTITLKDKSILVGTIDAGSTTGNTLKFQHGMGQGYYYKTSGDFTLQDLDGNQVVKGSAGSVGQGASETLDELLSYKSINLRNFFSKYNKLDDQDAWGETYASNLKRDAHTSNLALEYDLTNFGVNLINKIDNANFVIAFEGGRQDFVKDHKIDYQNISAGIYLPQKDNPYFNLDLFILGGVTLKDGERTILTNTTTSGKLTIDSDYETYEIHTGIKKNNSSSIPDFGLALSYSMTPNYDESKYFSWTDRHVGNLSIFFEDDYNLINNKDSKLFLGWTLDMRKMMGDKKQVYSINGTSATYKQHNDLTNEISLIANIGYEKKFSDKSKILFSLDAKNTNRYTKSLGANVSFKSKF